MTFTRTKVGLKNYPMMLNVDVVAFCEGGGSNLDPELDDVRSTPVCCDTLYWQRKLERKLAGKRVSVRAIGGKPAVLASFYKVQNQTTSGLYFCLDSDYDKLLKIHETDPRVLYTEGYSIENDIVTTPRLINLAARIEPTLTNKEAQEFAKEVSDLLKERLFLMRRFIIADISLLTLQRTRLFDGSLDRFIDRSQDQPRIDYVKLRRRTRQLAQNRPKMRLRAVVKPDPLKDLKGHCLFDLAYRIIKHVYRRKASAALPGNKLNTKKWLCAA